MARPLRLLFHRDFLAYTGGHGKVWHYFNHALAAGWDARVYFTPRSVFDASNPWSASSDRIEATWRPQEADALFLGGEDWKAVPEGLESSFPVFNLIQGIRHVDPDLPLRAFLARRALRICVGQPVADAILATGEVNGPVCVIPAAIDLASIDQSSLQRAGVVVDTLKRPALGAEVAELLRRTGVPVTLIDRNMPRSNYLAEIAHAEIAVLLPLIAEGFYLPALEAMALGVPVVTLDAVGNRAYLAPGENAIVPASDAAAVANAVHALLLSPDRRAALIEAGRRTAEPRTLAGEQAQFSALLGRLSSSAGAPQR